MDAVVESAMLQSLRYDSLVQNYNDPPHGRFGVIERLMRTYYTCGDKRRAIQVKCSQWDMSKSD